MSIKKIRKFNSIEEIHKIWNDETFILYNQVERLMLRANISLTPEQEEKLFPEIPDYAIINNKIYSLSQMARHCRRQWSCRCFARPKRGKPPATPKRQRHAWCFCPAIWPARKRPPKCRSRRCKQFCTFCSLRYSLFVADFANCCPTAFAYREKPHILNIVNGKTYLPY